MKHISTVIVKKRMIIVFLFGLFIFFIIHIRLGYVQFIATNQLTERATDLWSRDIVFEPDRGYILDSNGDVLAENVSAPSVVLVPRQINETEKTAEIIADILEMSYDKALEYVTKNASSVSIHPEGRKISEEKESRLRALNLEGL